MLKAKERRKYVQERNRKRNEEKANKTSSSNKGKSKGKDKPTSSVEKQVIKKLKAAGFRAPTESGKSTKEEVSNSWKAASINYFNSLSDSAESDSE